ncbi:hypothetical protein M3D15_04640 [Pseudoclavibacter alba]|uniref:Uncharacterized protein n=1 Tax=Pseudoclavibacter albus TaxID=272241 RepID=A0ABT2HWC7_9MICO|nr:hypothetical protein [Pseudoclavibacter alba]MCT2042622.1 hypothetical protein [Pseudoclavibacter alba]
MQKGDSYDEVEQFFDGDFGWIMHAPVAVAFTEDEVKALAKFLCMIDAVAQLDAFTDTSEEAANIVSAANVLTAAAGEIDANEFEPPLHEEDA